MKPPEAAVTTDAPAVSVCLQTLTKRAEFLACARAAKAVTPGFVLQARRRAEGDDPACIRIGFTASKKVGNAVARNRAKRRLRALARAVLPEAARPGWDYVLVARHGETAARPFTALDDDLRRALAKVHSPRQAS
ncbi:ribonuclease P protein component [Sinisalibacter aestuarii]|uniref:Ribonuclease P protein component n=1 Tax=Sinisalibacter aestuarii TaxID=2949426 RepID=A0ABQ5LYI3_9RHOB|nr:ribonuclease P protein component [Sinisalibacter aestuarii]GKY89167.1 ribonuclease P protein component [Sinisalibacter aestuarii]